MMWREIAELVELTEVPDGVGGYTTTQTARTVFCDQKSVRYDEFYKAHAVSLKPEMVIVIRNIDYDNEAQVRFKGKLYDVIRTHSFDGEIIELTCAKRTEVI